MTIAVSLGAAICGGLPAGGAPEFETDAELGSVSMERDAVPVLTFSTSSRDDLVMSPLERQNRYKRDQVQWARAIVATADTSPASETRPDADTDRSPTSCLFSDVVCSPKFTSNSATPREFAADTNNVCGRLLRRFSEVRTGRNHGEGKVGRPWGECKINIRCVITDYVRHRRWNFRKLKERCRPLGAQGSVVTGSTGSAGRGGPLTSKPRGMSPSALLIIRLGNAFGRAQWVLLCLDICRDR